MRRNWGSPVTIALLAVLIFSSTAISANEPGTNSDYVGLYTHGQDLLLKGDAAGAKVLFEQAAGLAPGDSNITRALIGACLVVGLKEDAEKKLINILSSASFQDIKDWAAIEYYKLAGEKDGIQAAIDKLAAIDKSAANPGLQRGIAEGYVRLRDWDKVAGIYADLKRAYPDDPVLLARLIDAYMLNKDYETVIAILEPKLKANPNDTASSDILAHAYVGAKKSEQAVALYKQKVSKEPNSPGMRGRYAQALLDLGMLAESLPEWKEAFKLDGKNLLFKQRVAEVYFEMGKTKEAKQEYTQLAGLIPVDQQGLKKLILSRIEAINNIKK